MSSLSSLRASSNKSRTCFFSAMPFFVNSPCFRAFLFPLGAPDPAAPPCMRQRSLPCTAGARQDRSLRVLAPQRGLASIALVLRA
ncbi:hypothetical protein NLN62_01755 [Bradyrhizobium sp. CCGUVB23]|nr:hypothetical protein [Bradyrhizobium sp. CCGUVB23]